MTSKPAVNVDGLIRKTRRYEFADGLVDLQMALTMASLGTLFPIVFSGALIRLGSALAEALGAWARWLSFIVLAIPALVALGSRHLLKYVRRRWLWRASGFVDPLPSAVSPRALILGTLILVVGIVAAVMLYRSGSVDEMLPMRMLVAGSGWAQGIATIGLSRVTGLSRYAWLGIAGGLVSTVFLFLPLRFDQAWLAFALLWATAFAVSGLVTLRGTLLQIRAAQDG